MVWSPAPMQEQELEQRQKPDLFTSSCPCATCLPSGDRRPGERGLRDGTSTCHTRKQAIQGLGGLGSFLTSLPSRKNSTRGSPPGEVWVRDGERDGRCWLQVFSTHVHSGGGGEVRFPLTHVRQGVLHLAFITRHAFGHLSLLEHRDLIYPFFSGCLVFYSIDGLIELEL